MNKAILFDTGRVVITANAHHALDRKGIHPALIKHVTGDWGDVCDLDKNENNHALKNGERILSAYKDCNGKEFWIITEADRSATTILLPEDY